MLKTLDGPAWRSPDAPVAEAGIASPLTLLLEEQEHADGQAEEALFLTCAADLGLFERLALGVIQACGARATVVSDAAMTTVDPRAVRRAGRNYLPGLASCRGAFHPKVAVLAGRRRATVAIGSGDLTVAGWQENEELWTVLRGDAARCPAVFADIASWLRRLPHGVRVSPGVPDALDRTASLLDALLEESAEWTDEGIRFVSSSYGPILDQLPRVRADELAVCAPFFGPDIRALRALVKRLEPGRLIVSYQPELTELDGWSLQRLAAELDTEIREGTTGRFRHGKLIEWTAGGQRFALTGSPDITTAALLHGLEQGGNCEAGLIVPTGKTLLHEEKAVPPPAVRAGRHALREAGGRAVALLGAVQAGDAVRVLFDRPLPGHGYLELSHADGPPETWHRGAGVPAAAAEAVIPVHAEGGSRVRLALPGADGTLAYSNTVLVVDLDWVLRRPGGAPAHAPGISPMDLFTDPNLAERFAAALRPPSADALSWAEYLDECAGRIGQPLLRFALGLPRPPAAGGAGDEESAGDAEVGLAGDASGRPHPVPAERDGADAPEQVRARYRRWAVAMAALSPDLPVIEQLLAVHAMLCVVSQGFWDSDDLSWFAPLAEAVRGLGQARQPAEAEPATGSLAAVALSILRVSAPRYWPTRETHEYLRTASAVGHLLLAAEPARIEEYASWLGTAFGYAAQPEAVLAVAAEVIEPDPIADGIRALAEIGREAHAHDPGLLHITGKFGNPVLAAIEGLGAVQDMDFTGVWAASDTGPWALVIWRKPDMVIIDGRSAVPLWQHRKLSPLQKPKALAAGKDLSGAPLVSHGAQNRPFPEATALLHLLGLSSPKPPAD